jgi:hypothetical protein
MMGIDEFCALLSSDEGEENALLIALRKLTELTKVEDVAGPIGPDAPMWW